MINVRANRFLIQHITTALSIKTTQINTNKSNKGIKLTNA